MTYILPLPKYPKVYPSIMSDENALFWNDFGPLLDQPTRLALFVRKFRNGPEFTSRRMLAWSENWKVGLVNIQPGRPMQRPRRELPRTAARRVPQRQLVPGPERCAQHPVQLAAGV
jgi:hypothetical protein